MSTKFNVKAAEKAQRLLARKIKLKPLTIEPRRVAGLDVSYLKLSGVKGEVGVGVAVIVSLENREFVVESCNIHVSEVCIPYIPGFLAFRELAVLAPAFTPLAPKTEAVLVDGHGIAHPRRFGIASHVGVIYNMPSIGVAKKRLAGVEVKRKGKTYLVLDSDVVGVVIRRGKRSLYVSPGHLVDVESSEKLVAKMLVNELPEPTRRADELSKLLKTIIKGSIPLAIPEHFLDKCTITVKLRRGPAFEIAERLKVAGFKALTL